jgi:hypothetical protein
VSQKLSFQLPRTGNRIYLNLIGLRYVCLQFSIRIRGCSNFLIENWSSTESNTKCSTLCCESEFATKFACEITFCRGSLLILVSVNFLIKGKCRPQLSRLNRFLSFSERTNDRFSSVLHFWSNGSIRNYFLSKSKYSFFPLLSEI